jgi:adenine phosphoribosyltransferase
MIDADLNNYIRRVPHYPKKGIMFYDISGLLLNPKVFGYIIDRMVEIYSNRHIDAVAGAEARGFLFAAPFAYKMGIPFIPIRKAGKLPGITLKASYTLEYGKGEIEVHKDDIPQGKNVLIVDDLLATGGTLRSAADIFEQGGATISEIFSVIGLTFLPYKERLAGYTITTLINYEHEQV